MAWIKLASVTLTGAGDNLSTGTITGKKFLQLLAHIIPTGVVDFDETFNNDTTTYAYRKSDNGEIDPAPVTSAASFQLHVDDNDDIFVLEEIIDISAEEKLVISFSCLRNTAGAANAPNRRCMVAKHDNAASQITEVDIDNATVAVDYGIDSNITAFGTD